MNNYKKFCLTMIFFIPFMWTGLACANNLALSSGTLTDQDDTGDSFDIEFDISWDNSWRDDTTTASWDAAWVFMKFSTDSGATWSHATLLNTGSVAPAGSTITFGDTGGVYKGAFIYRSSEGQGANSWTDVQIRWDYGADGVGDTDEVDIRLFGIEMVYIPQGSFYVGDTDNDNTNSLYEGGTGPPRTEFQITSEGAITVADTAGNLYHDADSALGGDRAGPIPADFPKGYDAFYIMKYETTQGQYVDFLNTLTRAQQDNRTASQVADQYAMSDAVNVNDRNGIRNPAVVGAGVITFGNDLDGITAHNTTTGDGTFNESDDGQWVAVNDVSWMDGAAYADWAALRPMTELEFTKACRGGQAAVDDEHAWGNATVEADTTSLTNSGAANETPDQGNLNYSSLAIDGPFRVGSFSDASSTRQNAGGSYYGVMELSGNLFERTVTIGHANGRAFTGTHGDGALSTDGYATNSDWPGYSAGEVVGALGAGFRGGGWLYSADRARVTNRFVAAFEDANRTSTTGFRGVRTAP